MRDEELTTISSREVGARMRNLREARGIRPADLAAGVGVTEGELTAWENGQGVAPHETMLALAKALGTTIDSLIS